MTAQLERKRFRDDWQSVGLFLVLVTLPTFWTMLDIQTNLQAAIGTGVANAIVGAIGWWFISREGVRVDDVGLGRRAWIEGLFLFATWWVLVTVVDVGGRWLADLFGLSLAPIGRYDWSLTTILQMISRFIFVGIGEEIAFRGYLHNKLVVVTKRRRLAILLAALTFGLWHTPADIVTGGVVLAPLLNAGLFALIGLLFFHVPYEWVGLLPFLALFHGWNDFLLLITLQPPTVVGAIAGYVLMWLVLWAYSRARGSETLHGRLRGLNERVEQR